VRGGDRAGTRALSGCPDPDVGCAHPDVDAGGAGRCLRATDGACVRGRRAGSGCHANRGARRDRSAGAFRAPSPGRSRPRPAPSSPLARGWTSPPPISGTSKTARSRNSTATSGSASCLPSSACSLTSLPLSTQARPQRSETAAVQNRQFPHDDRGGTPGYGRPTPVGGSASADLGVRGDPEAAAMPRPRESPSTTRPPRRQLHADRRRSSDGPLNT